MPSISARSVRRFEHPAVYVEDGRVHIGKSARRKAIGRRRATRAAEERAATERLATREQNRARIVELKMLGRPLPGQDATRARAAESASRR